MFNNLLESSATHERGVGGHAFSVALHVCVVAAAIVLTERVVGATPRPVDERLSFVEPPPPPPPPPDVAQPRQSVAPPMPRGHQVLIAPIDIPDVLPAIDLSRPITNDADFTGGGVAGGTHDGVIGAPPRPLSGEVTYFASQVEKPAVQIPGTGTPEYPELLSSAGVPGEVNVQFTVDTLGRADMSTFKVLRATNQLFADAVKKALPQMRFKPAETGAHKVRQIVEMPFNFSFRR